jgi:hypothetical protein
MHVDLYGLAFETPTVTVYLWSPWRASHLEHRLFDAVAHLSGVEVEKEADERRVTLTDQKGWRAALQAIARVMKGWQEEAESGGDQRSWRWLLEADTDCNGYEHGGDRASLWAFLRVALERGTLGEEEKREDIDLNDFGLRIWPIEDKD